MNSLCAFFLALLTLSFIPDLYAAERYDQYIPKIREKAEALSNTENAEEIGIINGEKYVCTIIDNDNSLFVSKIMPNGEYAPIARAILGDLPYPSVKIKNGSIIVHVGYGHHGVYDTDYTFKIKGGKFYLSEIWNFANFGEGYHDPSIQILTLTIANFENFKVVYWEKRFVLYKNGEEYKPGFRALGKAMDSIKDRFGLPSPPTKSVPLPKKRYALNNFRFEAVLRSLNHIVGLQSGNS